MAAARTLAAGYEFTHDRVMDPTWVPQPGQKWSTDAPKARMRVSRVTAVTVYYRYAHAEGVGWSMDRADFIARFAQEG